MTGLQASWTKMQSFTAFLMDNKFTTRISSVKTGFICSTLLASLVSVHSANAQWIWENSSDIPASEAGWVVDMSGSYAIAGAALDGADIYGTRDYRGAAYIFNPYSPHQTFEISLSDDDPAVDQRYQFAGLGADVAISDSWAAASIRFYFPSNQNAPSGAVALLPKPFGHSEKIIISGENLFTSGSSTNIPLALTDEWLVIGAQKMPGLGDGNHGAVILFRNINQTWTFYDWLTPNQSQSGDSFGSAVAIDNSRIVVGAPGHGNGGRAYTFEYINGSWQQIFGRTPNDSSRECPSNATCSYGSKVDISGNHVIISDPNHPSGGVVEIIELERQPWGAVWATSEFSTTGLNAVSVGIDEGLAVLGKGTQSSSVVGANKIYTLERKWNGQWQMGGTASDSWSASRLGTAVAIDSSTLISGYPNYSTHVNWAGAVFAYPFYSVYFGHYED